MKFTFYHVNFNVLDLERSTTLYEDGSYKLVFLGDGETGFQLELTWLRDHKEPYDLGEGEIHLAMRVDDYEAARKKHEEMGAVCFVNEKMGVYFIEDPDGYWIEILPEKR